MGISHIANKEFDLAEASFRRALHIKPDHSRVHANLGRLLVQKGNIPDALSHFNQAVKLAPGIATNHANLGFALAKTGQLSQAVVHLEQALKLQPDHADAQRNLIAIRKLIEKEN